MYILQQKSQKKEYDLEIKGQSRIFLKTVTLLIIQTSLWGIDGMCSSKTIAYDV